MAARKRGTFVPEVPRHIKLKRSRQQSGLDLRQSPMISMLIIANGYGQSPKSFVVRTDNRHYLFGCGEGVQRILMELSTRFLKINQVLLTQSNWCQAGGLVGLSISLESNGSDELTLHAPFKIKQWLESCRTVDSFRNLRIAEHNYETDGEYQDESFSIKQISLPSSPIPANDTASKLSGQTSREHRCFYIIDSTPLPPKLAIEKCVLYGVPANHLRRQLKDGQSVTLSDGRVVKPEDVLVPGYPEVRLLVVDIDHHGDSDMLRKQIDVVKESIAEHIPDYVVHLSPAFVQQSELYKSLMNEIFGKSCHVCLDETEPNVETNGIYKMQVKLNSVHKDFFPLFPKQVRALEERNDKCATECSSADEDTSQHAASICNQTFPTGFLGLSERVFAGTGVNINVRGKSFDTSELFSLHVPSSDAEGSRDSNECSVAAASSVENQEDSGSQTVQQLPPKAIDTNDNDSPSDLFPCIVFLGTGSACPSKLRNVSSILVRLGKECSILLDCGEGTLMQLHRIYEDSLDEVLRSLKIIFVSHMHPDHHQGLYGILEAWKIENSNSNEFITITCPSGLISIMRSTLDRFQQCDSQIKTHCRDKADKEPSTDNEWIHVYRNRVISAASEHADHGSSFDPELRAILDRCGIEYYKPVPVDHIYDSHGLVFKQKDGCKIVYSGDCRPSNELISAGKDADLLIHEATLEDGMEDDAKVVRHCTFSEALSVARKMKAKSTLLWHFSQRYSKVPSLSVEEMNTGNVAMTFDNMIVPMSRVNEFSELIAPLRQTFSLEFDLMEQKRLKAASLKRRIDGEPPEKASCLSGVNDQ